MKVYPHRTGALCANSHPGSYTGQDAFNDMLPVIRRTTNGKLLRGERPASPDVDDDRYEHAGLHARSANYYRGGGKSHEPKHRLPIVIGHAKDIY